MALPNWLDQVPNVDFTQEKDALRDLLSWGEALGWHTSDPSGMEFNARQSADIVLEFRGDRKIRIAVQSKSKSSLGMIRIQAIPTFREASIIWLPRRHQWQIQLGGVPIDRPWAEDSLRWLFERLFAA